MAGAPERRFLFGRAPRSARPGESLLECLARRGWPELQRSIRYHRPRGPFCGIGYCTGCLVRVNGRPNVRACRYVPADGDRVATENSWPSPRFDVLGAIDFLFPHGIDTLHGFVRPRWATRTYHRIVRRLAGYGAAPDVGPSPPSARPPPTRRAVDVAIVGGGVAGRAVAARLAGAGARPLVVERALAAEPVAGGELLARTTVTFLPAPLGSGGGRFALLGFEEPDRGVEISARAVVLATGGYDGSLLFGGNDRPGVVTADGALALLGPDRRAPFGRAVVVGGGDRVGEVLDRCGDAVAAVVAPGGISPSVVRRASDEGIPLYPRSRIVRAAGRARVRSLTLEPRGGGETFVLSCDAVVLAHRRLPSPQLLFQAGARMEWRGGTGAYYPVLSPNGETTVPGLYAVGDVAGVLPEAIDRAAERAAAAVLGSPVPEEDPLPRVALEGPNELEGYYRELAPLARSGRWIACACEDVLLDEVEEAHARGYRGIEVIKRYTGVGTGLCQGRYCLPDALLVLSILEGRPAPEVGYITQRPPAVPTPLVAFAAMAEPPPTPEGV